jgi:hypothetical protein
MLHDPLISQQANNHQCRSMTALFQLPLGPELARRLSAVGNVETRPVQPRMFRTHLSTQRKYSPQEPCLASGARLVNFSDGLTDALNVRGGEFGDERVVQCCLAMGAGTEAKDITQMLTRATAQWFGWGRAV